MTMSGFEEDIAILRPVFEWQRFKSKLCRELGEKNLGDGFKQSWR
jgi:hypothetical protein